MPDKHRLRYLFRKYLQNSMTDTELEELFGYIKNAKQEGDLKEYVTKVYRETQAGEENNRIDWEAMFSEIVGDIEDEPVSVKKRYLWRNIAAAVALLIIGTGAYFYLHQKSNHQDIAKVETGKQDIMPGGNKAILTLANGKKVALNNMQSGKLIGQGNVNIIKMNSGLLSYEKKERRNLSERAEIQYNTLTTPRGGQYELTLSDGTKVWLNAASSISYPVAFVGKERKVEITGEAYFEVAKNAEKPFIVKKGEVDIRVLGTHFNVMAYENEQTMKVTLLEGLVRVWMSPIANSQQPTAKSQLLSPGEQAVLDNGSMKVQKDVNVGNVMAWKNGYFAFNNASLEQVMRQLSRWYDIEVVYKEGADSGQLFSGKIGRDLTLSQVLRGLKQTSAHFEIKPNKRIVILR